MLEVPFPLTRLDAARDLILSKRSCQSVSVHAFKQRMKISADPRIGREDNEGNPCACVFRTTRTTKQRPHFSVTTARDTTTGTLTRLLEGATPCEVSKCIKISVDERRRSNLDAHRAFFDS